MKTEDERKHYGQRCIKCENFLCVYLEDENGSCNSTTRDVQGHADEEKAIKDHLFLFFTKPPPQHSLCHALYAVPSP